MIIMKKIEMENKSNEISILSSFIIIFIKTCSFILIFLGIPFILHS